MGEMRLELTKLQKLDKKTQKIKADGLNGYEEVDEVLHYQGLLFLLNIILINLINWYYSLTNSIVTNRSSVWTSKF